MRQVCCSTSSFRQAYHANRWDQAALFKAIADCAVDGAIVEERYFNERAMWWTRKGGEDLRKLGVELLAIGTSVELFAGPSERAAEQTANLMEWARIAALSGIPFLDVDLQGPDVGDWSVTGGVLRQAAEYAAKYGTLLILRRAHQPDCGKLLQLARSIGYQRCRLGVASASAFDSELQPWIREVIVRGSEPIPPVDPLLVCIEAADTGRAVEQIVDAATRLRRNG